MKGASAAGRPAGGTDQDRRLAAVRDLMVADVRDLAGWHEYDGQVQDLSAANVARGVLALGPARQLRRRWEQIDTRHLLVRFGLVAPPAIQPVVDAPRDPEHHDDLQLQIFEQGLRWWYGDFQVHRRDPQVHLNNLDLSCYERDYAPPPDRAAARARHLAGWPDAIDAAVTTLDAVPAPVATALLAAARGLARPVSDPGHDGPIAAPAVVDAAVAAHARLVAHLERCARDGDPQVTIGAHHLSQHLGAFDGLIVHVGALAERADAERDRIRALLAQACTQLEPHRPTRDVVAALMAQRPPPADVIPNSRALTDEVIAFCRDHDLVPWSDGECLVGPAPPSRSWAMAMLAWAGPYEEESPSHFDVTPPDPSWPAADIDDWLTVFGATTLPSVVAHEVAPGHFSHARALRRVPSPVRRQLQSMTFAEGWAHYGEEVMIEVGFRSGDPRFAIGVYLESLIRTTRLVCAIGLHTGALDVAGAARLFERDAFMAPAAARSEAARGTFDAGYGRYTLGKIVIRGHRERARATWGADFSLPRYHRALLSLGSPPLTLLGAALH